MADESIPELFVSHPITTIDAGDLIPAEEDTGGTPTTGAFKASQLMVNRYKLSVTVVSNDLVVALVHEDDTAPSTDRPLYFKINNTLRIVSAATSITIADGTNWFSAGSAELATKEIDYFVYLIWDSNSSIVAIAPARISSGRLVSDFSATTTNEKYLGNYANFSITDDVCVIGRFAATLSAGAGYTWTVPTFTGINLIHIPTFETRWLTWTPVVSQGVSTNIAKTIDKASYKLIGDLLEYALRLAFTATGTAGSAIIFTLPFTPKYLNYFFNGYGNYRDTGTASYDIFIFNNNSTNQCIFNATSVTAESAAVGTNPNIAVASTDTFLGQGFLEV